MRNQYLSVVSALLLSVFLTSCTKKEIEYDKDQEFDLKANKMEQIGILFESIARQPEKADLLIKTTENLYFDYNELLPISDEAVVQRGKSRGYSFGLLLESIARQPEAFNKLDSAAAKFLGAYNSEYISDEMAEITKANVMGDLYLSIARQPEAASLFNIICKKYLNFELPETAK